MELSDEEMKELQEAFKDLINYESDEPTTPIDPLTYVNPEGDNCLHIGAFRGNYRAIELLLKAGVDVNRIGDMGNTALHYSNLKGYKHINKLLLKNGASLEIRNEFGKLPLEFETG